MAETKFDFVRAVHKLVKERRLVIIITLVMAVIGIFMAISSPKTFNSTVVLAPELTNTNRMSESLGSLTAMIGIDLNSMNNHNVDAIFPEIYPKVVTSPDFVVQLWNCPVTLEDGTTKSYYEHICEDRFSPFWAKPFEWIASIGKDEEEDAMIAIGDSLPDPRFFDSRQEGIVNLMARNIMCDVAKDNGLITITVTDDDPIVACAIADTVQSKLQEYITTYRTKKARVDYEYSKKLVDEARKEYLDAQLAAARFADANISVFKQKVIIERDVLQNEFQLKYNTYNALSQQLQNAKALIQANTPVYTIIRHSSVANRASSTPRSLLVIMYALVGLLLAIVWIVFGRDYLKQIRNQYNEIESEQTEEA
jgi:capsular polysaccharide biosynthesis protein